MRPTRIGLLLAATGWACFPLALVLNSVTPALLGVLLVALVSVARPIRTEARVVREVPERVVAGEPFEVVTRAESDSHAPLFLEDDAPAGLRVLHREHHAERGRATLTSRYVSADPGARVWERARVRHQDAWGLVESANTVPTLSYLPVYPEARVVAAGRVAGRQAEFDRHKSRGSSDWENEIDHIREYQPGDRFRDIDWAHTTQLQKLITRELKREAPRPVVILLQATQSMRWERRVSKLATASRASLAFLAAAQSAALSTGFVAWSDDGLVAQVRASQGRRAVAAAVGRVAQLPTVQAPKPNEAPLLDVRPSLETALQGIQRVTSQPSLVVALLDAEDDPRFVRLLIQRLTRQGHRVAVVSPASGPHHYSRRDLTPPIVDTLIRWRRNREEARRVCNHHRAPFLALGPHLDDQAIQEVVRSAA